MLPSHINKDNELDLFVQDHSEQLFWVNNIVIKNPHLTII